MSTQASSWNRRSNLSDLQINVFNRQRRHRVDRQALRRFLQRLSKRLSVERAFAVVLVSDRAIQKYNRRFAGRDAATDVLSFPGGNDAGEDEESILGDIIISAERAEEQTPDSLELEIERLALHGLLHLLGYDHETDGGKMFALETELQREFGLT